MHISDNNPFKSGLFFNCHIIVIISLHKQSYIYSLLSTNFLQMLSVKKKNCNFYFQVSDFLRPHNNLEGETNLEAGKDCGLKGFYVKCWDNDVG